ncbi:MAG: enoyl-CoA hydratase/isomerase family protein [Actinobacteria bacterium]|nr:enoyl-CoA hydratase/isomerase family protein [Actinomycetota bacterium]
MILAKHVKARVEGHLGRVTLDRPEAINALTQAMIEEIDFALDRFEADPEVAAVVLDGTGERGFCAGGDVVALRASALEGGAAARRFWRDEYRLNARIASYPKPLVAIMHGIVMGGGVGLAGHAGCRIATADLTWAMPEVSIGFAPDVGATYLLSRLPGELGAWLALTARRVDAAGAVELGLADAALDREGVERFLRDLASGDPASVIGALAPADRTVAGPPGALREWVDTRFAGDDVEAIEAALAGDGAAPARATRDAMRRGSPTSLKVTLATLRAARHLPSLDACLEQEYRTSCSFLAVEDFREGIRAVLVDKDGAPRWDPPALERVDAATVDRILAGPGDLEPLWDGDRHERSRAWTSV